MGARSPDSLRPTADKCGLRSWRVRTPTFLDSGVHRHGVGAGLVPGRAGSGVGQPGLSSSLRSQLGVHPQSLLSEPEFPHL